jgi:hypothetical protein
VIAGVNGEASDIGVVEVEVAESGAIGEGRELRCRTPIGTDDGGITADRKRDVTANIDRCLVEGADATSDCIDKVRLDPLIGRSIDILNRRRSA